MRDNRRISDNRVVSTAVEARDFLVEARYFLQAKRSYHARLGHPPGHFYSPIPSAADIRRVHNTREYPTDLVGIDIREGPQLALVAEMGATSLEMPFTDSSQPGLRYQFDNLFFLRGDGVMLYGILRHFEPKRVIEVGSGFSSALMLDVNDRWLSGKTRFTFIEPDPERLNALLRPADKESVTLLTKEVQDVDLGLFDQLESGDILFIDSSHVSKIGSDLNHLIFNVLPHLRAGVIVHFHDIFWPFEYIKDWAEAGWAWNEDYLLRAFLSYNTHFEILLFNNWLAHFRADRVLSILPGWSTENGSQNGSLWLRVAGSS
jgi:predicted O-methyltransferase YrrM